MHSQFYNPLSSFPLAFHTSEDVLSTLTLQRFPETIFFVIHFFPSPLPPYFFLISSYSYCMYFLHLTIHFLFIPYIHSLVPSIIPSLFPLSSTRTSSFTYQSSACFHLFSLSHHHTPFVYFSSFCISSFLSPILLPSDPTCSISRTGPVLIISLLTH